MLAPHTSDWWTKLSIAKLIRTWKYMLMTERLIKASNNEAEYEALIAGLRITAEMGVRNVRVSVDCTPGRRKQELVEELPHVMWAHCTMIKSSHGDTPFSLTYGTEAVIPAEIGMPTYRTVAVDTIHNDEEIRLNLDLLEEKRERAVICEAKAKMKMTKYYNAKVRGVAFRLGDFVYPSNDASHAAAGEKLGPKWEGPYEVTEALGDEAYKLRTMGGVDLPRT
ncbi:reverse transcriptase domain-containing protein [Tanacetum coccineum]